LACGDGKAFGPFGGHLRDIAIPTLPMGRFPTTEVTMATIMFKAYRIHEVHSHGVSIEITAATEPFPSEKIEATRVPDVQAAFQAYIERARATGQRLQLSAFVRHGRSPTGFDRVFREPTNVNI
jgi:hypothetical protein